MPLDRVCASISNCSLVYM